MTKAKLARRMRTQEDIRKRVPIYQTDNWENRKEGIRQRVLLKQAKQAIKKTKQLVREIK